MPVSSMSTLFEKARVGKLDLRNRLMRSATNEYMADPHTGAPDARLRKLYRDLGEGGVGLIVTGHVAVEMEGRGTVWMGSIASDDLVPLWGEAIRPAQQAGARVMVQINHTGASKTFADNPPCLSPSGVATSWMAPSRPYAASEGEIERVIRSFGQAARRAQEAGFDGVQIHAAHGYLVSQFLSPSTNLREDRWGGEEARRSAFLIAAVDEVRRQVGPDYPVWLKLGVESHESTGYTAEMGAKVAELTCDHGVDCIEVSHCLRMPKWIDSKEEGYNRPMAEVVRERLGPDFPLALVGGFRTRQGMQAFLDSGLVQMVSLSRPLIAEPDLPDRFERGESERVECVRCDLCRAERPGDGIGCHREGGGLDLGRPLESLDLLRG